MLLVLALLGAATTAYLLDRGDPQAAGPAAVPPPPGLSLPAVGTPEPVAEPATGTPVAARVRRAVAGPLEDADLGPRVLATVVSLDGRLLYSAGTGAAIPASTLKLLTAAAALETLGPEYTFETTVVSAAPRRVVLVGGGDPLLSEPDLRSLARQTAAHLAATGGPVRVGYDISLFSGPAVNPSWPPSYVSEGVVSPIQALWVDEGRDPDGLGRVADPAATAAALFAAVLVKAGVRVAGPPTKTEAPTAPAALATVSSDPLGLLVEHTLETSDNEAAEVLARQVGLATSGQGSFAGGVRGILETLDILGIPTAGATLYDGSGLSRDNRVDPDTLTAALEVAGSPDHPELRSVTSGLPVAGFTGSLVDRFETTASGRGFVRAKTGTLSGVSGLSGIVTDRDGTAMVFAFLADRIDLVDTLDARAALDAATSALADCRCGTAGTVAP